jgi:hypothetical protein
MEYVTLRVKTAKKNVNALKNRLPQTDAMEKLNLILI